MHTNDAVLAPLPHRRRTSSFSSSLLDAICRSLDDDSSGGAAADGGNDELIKLKKHSVCSELVSAKDFFTEPNAAVAIDSASSSKADSCGGVFSSSDDAELHSNHRISSISTSQRNRSELDKSRAKKIHGFSSSDDAESNSSLRISAISISPRNRSSLDQNRKNKIHGELKKQRQPISPGARIASFLNSVFSSGNGNKVKICSIGSRDDEIAERKPKSTCSSCFSKTPPPRAKEIRNDGNRSVRFYSASVVVDDDPGLMPIRKIEKKDDSLYIRHNVKKKVTGFDLHGYFDGDEDSEEEEEEEDDLFELDHLIGDGGLGEELPVFGTTDFKANQAIANGFVV